MTIIVHMVAIVVCCYALISSGIAIISIILL
jgi:hypothetical protein